MNVSNDVGGHNSNGDNHDGHESEDDGDKFISNSFNSIIHDHLNAETRFR